MVNYLKNISFGQLLKIKSKNYLFYHCCIYFVVARKFLVQDSCDICNLFS